MDVLSLDAHKLCKLGSQQFKAALAQLLEIQENDRRDNQLAYYNPVSPTAEGIHNSTARVLGVGGGNGSSKTDTCLAELSALATGVFPDSLKDNAAMREKFRGPVKIRVVVESLTTTLHPIILPKLQYWSWQGNSAPGGEQGHWGWIPRDCLLGGRWDRAWSEKLRMLRVLCRDPDDRTKVLGESHFQFMSYDQDPSDFASGDFHHVMHDEVPSYAIWRENEARTMRVSGRMMLAMTWPDDPAIPVDWIFDEIYEPGEDPENTRAQWINLETTDNPHLNQDAIQVQREAWSEEVVKVRILGQPIRFSNRVHELFTDVTHLWCFDCGRNTSRREGGKCACGSENIEPYNHVREVHAGEFPVVFLLDPHPRKEHMMAWVAVTPFDDLWQIAESNVKGGIEEVAKEVRRIENEHGLVVRQRLIDPNMGRSPSSARRRDVTWQEEFDEVGVRCDLASDSDVGRNRINHYLMPDNRTLEPRISIHPRCHNTIRQMKRYVWDDYRQALEKAQKQLPKNKEDDYPTLWKYLLNSDPAYRFLKDGPQITGGRSRASQRGRNVLGSSSRRRGPRGR